MIRSILPLLLSAAAGEGHVVQATAVRAYLDRGAEDGLAPGMDVALLRGARPVGTCRVETVAPHHATCIGAGVREGDLFELAPAPDTRPAPALLPTLLDGGELGRRNAIVRAAPGPWVVNAATPAAPGLDRPFLEAAVGHATWTTLDAGSTFHQERLDLALRGVPAFAGFRFYGDLTAVAYATRPEGVTAFRPGTRSFLLVHEAELSSRDAGTPYVLAVGRVWPWHAPGAPTFDGAQAGFRRGGWEGGIFGGGLPGPDTLEPSLQAWTAGAYFMGQRGGGSGAFSFLRQEGRLAAIHLPGVGTRGEAELSAFALPVQALDVSASIRLHAGDGLDAPGVAAGRAEIGVRPVEVVRVSAGARFLDREAVVAELATARGAFAAPASSRHGDLSVAWDVTPFVTVAAAAGVADEISSRWVRRWVGPEVTFPHAVSGPLAFGYQEEVGSHAGRAAWTQATVGVTPALGVFGRLSYYEDRASISDAATRREAGLLAGGQLELSDRLELSTTLLVRPEIPQGGEEVEVPVGIAGDLRLRGRW